MVPAADSGRGVRRRRDWPGRASGRAGGRGREGAGGRRAALAGHALGAESGRPEATAGAGRGLPPGSPPAEKMGRGPCGEWRPASGDPRASVKGLAAPHPPAGGSTAPRSRRGGAPPASCSGRWLCDAPISPRARRFGPGPDARTRAESMDVRPAREAQT